MNKQSLIFIIALLAVAGVLVGFLMRQGAGNEPAGSAQFTVKDAVAAPNFTLSDVDGNNVTLSSLLGKNVVLFFTEGLTCYPCLDQMVELSKDPRLNNDETVSYSLTFDSPEDWGKAKEYLSVLAEVRVLFDKGRRVAQAYAALNLSSALQQGHHPHTFFIIDKEGVVRYVLDDPYMGIRNDMLVAEIRGRFK